jgi:hypothetical protein
MKRIVFLGILIVAAVITARAQTVYRVDPSPVMTTAGTGQPGGYPALYAVAGATINICTDAACTIPATTYANQRLPWPVRSALRWFKPGRRFVHRSRDLRGNSDSGSLRAFIFTGLSSRTGNPSGISD